MPTNKEGAMSQRGQGLMGGGRAAWRRAALLLLAVIALTGVRVHADGGRDFAGEFAIVSQDPIDAQNTLVTVRLRVQNVSGHDVASATVELVANPVSVEGLKFPTQLTLADRDMAVIEGSFTVPAADAALGNVAGRPVFRVTYTDASGSALQRPVEAIQVPFVMEGQP
jgi:hypothetical protein